MKIIILGAGQVGSTLAGVLSAERHDVTVIDSNEQRLRELQNALDIRTVCGFASYPDILSEAGAENADMLLAVTDNDEVNMIACQVAYSVFHTPTKMARVRASNYLPFSNLFSDENLPIDCFIRAEELVTRYIVRLIEHPGALQVLDFCNGEVCLVVVKAYYGGLYLGKSIAALKKNFSDIELSVVSIYRGKQSIIFDDDTTIELNDEVFFMVESDHVHAVILALRRVEGLCRRVMIAGGGHIGASLAAVLEEKYHVKLIEQSRRRCNWLSKSLDSTIVIHGNANDKKLLVDEDIEEADVFCAVTNDNETNIISCLQAKRLGVKQAMTLMTEPGYMDLVEGGPINIAIAPEEITIGAILSHIRKGDVIEAYSLRRGAAEAIEVVAQGDRKTSRVVGRRVDEIRWPKEVHLAALIRRERLVSIQPNVVIESGDHAVLFVSDKAHMRDAEKLFQVGVSFL